MNCSCCVAFLIGSPAAPVKSLHSNRELKLISNEGSNSKPIMQGVLAGETRGLSLSSAWFELTVGRAQTALAKHSLVKWG